VRRGERAAGSPVTPRNSTWLLVFIAMAVGCGEDRFPSGYGLESNTRAAIEAAPAWTLAGTPDLGVGVLEGPDEEELNRVEDVHLTHDRLYILDGGDHVVRAFDREARHLFSVGREGDGPGEFRRAQQVTMTSEPAVAVWDRAQQRLTLLGEAGAVEETVTARISLLNPELLMVGRDGSFLLMDTRYDQPMAPETEGVGTIPVIRFSPDGEVLDTLDVLDGPATVRWARFEWHPKPFSGVDLVTGGREGVWLLRSDTASAIQIGLAGDTLRTIEWDPGDRQVTASEIDAFFAFYVDLVGEREERLEEIQGLRDSGMFASRHPVASDLMADEAGRLWIKEPMRFSEETDRPWLVFDGEGRIVARMYMPEGDVRLFDADETHAVVRVEDALGVDRVELRRIVPRDDDASIATPPGVR